MSEAAALRVIQPGMLTTVQDLGRSGLARYGVTPGGALDRRALILGNRLLGNDPGEAGLELTLIGPELVATGPAVVALTGADLGARLNDEPLPRWRPVALRQDDVIWFDPSAADGRGARAYLCVAGGFAIEPVLGSRSTDLTGQFGGIEGRPLAVDDVLMLRGHNDPSALLRRRLAKAIADSENAPLRVVLGPQVERFTEAGIETFLNEEFTVTARADRTGVRLSGPAIELISGADLVSEGIAAGAVQVPGDGQPILLLRARQTVGGYTKIATVIGADLDRLAQLRPGIRVHFSDISPEEARALTLAYWQAVDEAEIVDYPESQSITGPETIPAGMRQVVETMKATGLSSLRVEGRLPPVGGGGPQGQRGRLPPVGGGGPEGQRGKQFRLRLEFRGAEPITSSRGPTPPPPPPRVIVVHSPALGRFFRRREPGEPLLAEAGQRVVAGDPLGVIEVMKTYHEVAAPVSGLLTAFLIEDEQVVEYGQPVARIEVAR
jgi:antagonist of KipI